MLVVLFLWALLRACLMFGALKAEKEWPQGILKHMHLNRKDAVTDKEGERWVHSPVEQFTIKVLYDLSLFGYDISFTNSALFMVLAIIVSCGFLALAMRPAAIIPGRMQSLAEVMYEFVAEMIRDNVGKEGSALTFRLFSLCSCLFYFLIC